METEASAPNGGGRAFRFRTLAKKIIELERKNDKQFKEVFKILDGLVEETKNVDEKVMGFLSKK